MPVKVVHPLSTARRFRPRIAVALPRGESFRNFVYSGVLDRLSEEAEVVVFSVHPADYSRKELGLDVAEIHDLPPWEQPRPVAHLYTLLRHAHDSRSSSPADQYRWRQRVEQMNESSRVGGFLKPRIAVSLGTHSRLKRLESGLERLIAHTAPAVSYKRKFSSLALDLFFNTSQAWGDPSIPAVVAAKALGIPTAAFVFSWDNPTATGRMFPLCDHYLVWNELMRSDLLSIYPELEPRRVIATGSPQFDFHRKSELVMSRQRLCEREGLDPARPFLLYTTAMVHQAPAEDRIVEGVMRALGSLKSRRDAQLLVRVFAKDQSRRFDHLVGVNPDVRFQRVEWDPTYLTPLPEDSAVWISTLTHCAAGMNVASTVSLELCLFGKPVINIAYGPPGFAGPAYDYRRFYDYLHYRPLVESGAVDLALSEEDLTDVMDRALAEPERTQEAQKKLVESFFGSHLDGRSAERAAETLLILASGSRDVERGTVRAS